jgi:TetR/AcrR family transcriptional regulator, fatty acid metabolism regulator protein
MLVKQRESKFIRQQQIMVAAKKLLVQYGSEHITVRKLAKEIGVTEGAIYRHFESKKQILSFLLDDIENNLTFDIDETNMNNSNPMECLQRALFDRLSNTEQKKGISFQIMAEIISLGDRQLNNKAYVVINNFVFQVKNILLKAKINGDVKPEFDPDTIALLLFGMMQGLVTLWSLSQNNIDLEKQYRNLWHFIYQSISQN